MIFRLDNASKRHGSGFAKRKGSAHVGAHARTVSQRNNKLC